MATDVWTLWYPCCCELFAYIQNVFSTTDIKKKKTETKKINEKRKQWMVTSSQYGIKKSVLKLKMKVMYQFSPVSWLVLGFYSFDDCYFNVFAEADDKVSVFHRIPWPACGWSDVTDSVVMDGGDGVCVGLEVLHTY